MFKNKRLLAVSITLIFTILFAGCKSNFEKLRLSTDTSKKYQEAIKYYNKKEYSKALILFESLVQRYKGRAEAEDLYYYYAYTHYRVKDFLNARYHFKIFADTYPTSPKAEETRFMAAYCYYLDSPNYSLDQDNTVKAIDALQLFINLYPKSERVAEASKLIQNLRDKLEAKAYANAKLYYDIGDYKAAVIAFKNTARDFPDTKYAEELAFLSIKAQHLYAKNSFENKQEARYADAIQLYNEFAEAYPSSKFLKEAEELKKDSERSITEVKKLLAAAAAETPKKEEESKDNKSNNNE